MSIPVTPAAASGSSGLKFGLIGLGSIMLINTFGLQSLVPLILPFVLIAVGAKIGGGAKWGLIGLGSIMLINSFGLQSLVPLILPFVLIAAGVKMAGGAAAAATGGAGAHPAGH